MIDDTLMVLFEKREYGICAAWWREGVERDPLDFWIIPNDAWQNLTLAEFSEQALAAPTLAEHQQNTETVQDGREG